MANIFTENELKEVLGMLPNDSVLKYSIDTFKLNGNWVNKSGKDIPLELQNKVNALFDLILQEYPDRIVHGFKNAYPTPAKKAIELRRELGYGEDVQSFFSDFGFYYDLGPIAQCLVKMRLENGGEENPYANLEPSGAACIDIDKVYVDGHWKSLSGKECDSEVQSRLDNMFDKLLLWYPARVVVNFNKEHRKFAEKTVLGVRRIFDYPDNETFFADFGFEYINKNKIAIEKKDKKIEIKSFVEKHSLLNEYYNNSKLSDIFTSTKNIFSDEFKALFNAIVIEEKVNITLEDVYNLYKNEEYKSVLNYINKPSRIYSIPRNSKSNFIENYYKIKIYNDFSNGCIENSKIQKVDNEIVSDEKDKNEVEITPNIVENVMGNAAKSAESTDDNIIKSIINDLCHSKRTIANIFKGKEEYMYHPSVILSSALDFDKTNSRGKIWQVLDYSNFNQVRVALLFLVLGIEPNIILSYASIKKAFDYKRKYIKNKQDKVFYLLMNGIHKYYNIKSLIEVDDYINLDMNLKDDCLISSIEENYNRLYPNDELRNVLINPFEYHNPNSNFDIDNLDGYTNAPKYSLGGIVQVKFKGGTYLYDCEYSVAIGSKVYVTGAKKDTVGVVVSIKEDRHNESLEKVIVVLNEIADLKLKFEEVFPGIKEPVIIHEKSINNNVESVLIGPVKEALQEEITEDPQVSEEDESDCELVEETVQEEITEEQPVSEEVKTTCEPVQEEAVLNKAKNVTPTKTMPKKIAKLYQEILNTDVKKLDNFQLSVGPMIIKSNLSDYIDVTELIKLYEEETLARQKKSEETNKVDELIEEQKVKKEDALEEKYQNALELFNGKQNLTNIKKVLKLFEQLKDYKDSNEYVLKCNELIDGFYAERNAKIKELLPNIYNMLKSSEQVDEKIYIEYIKKINNFDSDRKYYNLLYLCLEFTKLLPMDFNIENYCGNVSENGKCEELDELLALAVNHYYNKNVLPQYNNVIRNGSKHYRDWAQREYFKFIKLVKILRDKNIFIDVNKFSKIVYDNVIDKYKIIFNDISKQYVEENVKFVSKCYDISQILISIYNDFPVNDDNVSIKIINEILYILKKGLDRKLSITINNSEEVYKEFKAKADTINARLKEVERLRLLALGKEKQERIRKYWESNQELKNSLLSEKDKLNKELNEANITLSTKEDVGKENSLLDKKKKIELEISKCNFLQGKKKKMLQEELNNLEVELKDVKDLISNKNHKLMAKTKEINKKMDYINLELTKDRL